MRDVYRAFQSIFPKQRMVPPRSSWIPQQVRDPAHIASNVLMGTEIPVQNPRFADKPREYTELRRPTLYESARNALPLLPYVEPTALDIIPGLGKMAKLGGFAGMAFGARSKAKELGLQTIRTRSPSIWEGVETQAIRTHDPSFRQRHGLRPDAKDVMGSRSGDVVSFVNFRNRPNLSPAARDMFSLETGTNLRGDIPLYYVDYTEALKKRDPTTGELVMADPAYAHETLDNLLKEAAKDLPPGKVYAVEADLLNHELMDVADQFGLLGFQHGYGSHAVYFAKNGRLIPLPTIIEQFGELSHPSLAGAVSVKELAANYRAKKKAERAARAAGDPNAPPRFSPKKGPKPQEATPADIDWLGEGDDFEPDDYLSRYDEERGFTEGLGPGNIEAGREGLVDSALDYAMTLEESGDYPMTVIVNDLRNLGYDEDIIAEVRSLIRDRAYNPPDVDASRAVDADFQAWLRRTGSQRRR